MSFAVAMLIVGLVLTCIVLRLDARALKCLLRKSEADVARIAAAGQHMQRAADGFRELYLRELSRNQPAMAEHLRHKWAAQNAPVHVAQLLERAKHG